MPHDVTAAGAFALILVFYVVGHAIQGLAGVGWVRRVWTRLPWNWFRPEPPFRTEMLTDASGDPYGTELMELLEARIARRGWPALKSTPRRQLVSLVRAELRLRAADARAESLLSMIFLSEGLAAAGAIGVVALVVDGAAECDWRRWAASAGVLIGIVLVNRRRDEYDRRYADHVWADFAALAGESTASDTSG
jgi:hypothetical protein